MHILIQKISLCRQIQDVHMWDGYLGRVGIIQDVLFRLSKD
jgi:hypothetical protein